MAQATEKVRAAAGKAGPLGIIAGSGSLPAAIAEAAMRQGRAVHILAFRGADIPGLANYPHSLIRWGEVGKLFASLKTHDCRDVVLVGRLQRPNLWKIRPDFGLLASLPAILKLTRGGDDSVLKRVVRLFEGKGFRVVGAHEIAPELTAPEGPLGSRCPSTQDMEDIALGMKVVAALGKLDVGQAAAVARGYVLAVEAAEGTDEMLRRCRSLHQWGLKQPSGVLVKCPKPGQELRIDMPVIGPHTVDLAADAGLRGIAVASGQVLLAEPQVLVERAEARGLFVIGISQAERL